MNGKSPLPKIGAVEWFRPGEHERVERAFIDLERLGISHLRTGFSWADYHTEEGRDWYDWLMPRLGERVDVLPCFTYTPPSLGLTPKSSAPPRNPKDYADFIDVVISRHGDHFDWIELWNEPNNLKDWDWRMDPEWTIFGEMVAMAANWCHVREKKTVLGGMCPTDPVWLATLARNGTLEHIDAVGVHGFPGTWEYDWTDWNDPIEKAKYVLIEHGIDAEIWVTEAGYSTWNHDEFTQIEACADLLCAPADRVYWYSLHDLHPNLPHQDGFHADERHYHFGLFRHDGRDKLLSRIWREDGPEGIWKFAELGERHADAKGRPHSNGAAPTDDAIRDALTVDGDASHDEAAPARDSANDGSPDVPLGSSNGRADHISSPLRIHTNGSNGAAKQRYTLVTGGAGFIGTNMAHRLLESGRRVKILDSLSRPGVERNLRWLSDHYGGRLEVQLEDVRDRWAVSKAVARADQVFHFAAQVAVTSSVEHPREDFEVNARGTLNVLEALRQLESPPPLLFTSTNKVYGCLDDVRLEADGDAYRPVDPGTRSGIGAERPLDFESPYGCSKGAADEYVLDYCRMYGLPTVVFRMSCIYGPHQFGTEDQGWVAHFLLRALRDEPITIYGDGRQVRDLLFVHDLIDAMLTAMNNMDRTRGRAFNIGGGPARAVSLLQVLDLIREVNGRLPDIAFEEWRPSDQRYYVSDTSRFEQATGWQPKVDVEEGLRRLHRWMVEESTIPNLEPSL